MKSSTDLQMQDSRNQLLQTQTQEALQLTREMEGLIKQQNAAVQKAEAARKAAADASATAAKAKADNAENAAELDTAATTAQTNADAAQADVDALSQQVAAARNKAQAQQELVDKLSSDAESGFWQPVINSLTSLNTWVWLILLLGVGYILLNCVGYDKNSSLLVTLKEQASARAMITMLVLGTAMSLAIMLVYQAYQVGTTNESFRMAREIFGTLIGIVGTIIGFYFGNIEKVSDDTAPPVIPERVVNEDGGTPGGNDATDKPEAKATLKDDGKQLVMNITKGKGPFSIKVKDKSKPSDGGQTLSQAQIGEIPHPLNPAIAKENITITVKDADQKTIDVVPVE